MYIKNNSRTKRLKNRRNIKNTDLQPKSIGSYKKCMMNMFLPLRLPVTVCAHASQMLEEEPYMKMDVASEVFHLTCTSCKSQLSRWLWSLQIELQGTSVLPWLSLRKCADSPKEPLPILFLRRMKFECPDFCVKALLLGAFRNFWITNPHFFCLF